MVALNVRSDGSEVLRYNAPDYPVRTGAGQLSAFADYAAECHWHRDLEILLAIDHEMDYFVNGAHIHLLPGQAVFANAGRLHYGYSAGHEDCRYCFAVFPPEWLGLFAPVAAQVERLTAPSSADWLLLRPEKPLEKEAIGHLTAICQSGGAENALNVLAHCAALTACLCALCDALPTVEASADWAVLRRMVGYIQAHYTERILLEDVAAAGAVCRSRCCRLFRDHLGQTPAAYITRYRLSKSCEALRQGASITEAALQSGFAGASYYAETFRKVYGETPSEYKTLVRAAKS